ncbi:unnamed protein product [Mytilus edulis]|uniref:Uncharacterized protein n=1 Tax=Mytilus edulis TaxID=6550 RepID=A0A8S3UG85_MYTED|nr:unnamed protein product [Mytilus edulis]
MKNKPEEAFEKGDVENCTHIKQSSALHTLCQILPLILGPKVEMDNEHWINFLRLVQIVLLCLSSYCNRETASVLRILIGLYLRISRRLYPKASLVPKALYLLTQTNAKVVQSCQWKGQGCKYFVLDIDGTEVEDGEILLLMEKEPMVFLGPNEEWVPQREISCRGGSNRYIEPLEKMYMAHPCIEWREDLMHGPSSQNTFPKGSFEFAVRFGDKKLKENIEDDDVKNKLKSKEMTPPHLVIFKSESKKLAIYIVGDSIHITCQGSSVTSAITQLLAIYYVFDIDYPKCYAMVLGLLQIFVMNEAFTYETSKKFKFFAKKFRTVFDSFAKED